MIIKKINNDEEIFMIAENNKAVKLKNLLIKPTLKCNGNCSFCNQRLNYYKKSTTPYDLSFKKWLEIIDEAISLGVKVINISGGEPTLYRELVDLVVACSERSLGINLKTNGSLLNDKLIKNLAVAGLNSCTISIYSKNPEIHNKTKVIKDSHNLAMKAIERLKKAGIKTNIQTVLTPHIMGYFDEYLNWVAQLKINYLFISYLEGDEKVKRPSSKEISDFVTNMVPKCKNVITQNLNEVPQMLKENLDNLDRMYKFDGISYEEMGKGIYNKGLKGCGRNSSMALILAIGKIHPCNAVEYFHEPIVGDLKKETLKKAWQSKKWQKVKSFGLKWCYCCPMNRHTFIQFSKDNVRPSFYTSPN